jgi:5-formyltetrahydrofolate cyclo-ligase
MTDRNDESRIARTPAADSTRTALRQALLDARRRLSAPRRRAANEALVGRLDALLGDVAGRSIALYWPIRGEPSLDPLPGLWAARGARTALPVVDAPRTPLRFVAWRPGEPTVPGLWNIPRPATDVALRPDVVIVPCVGFTTDGHRLGYGGGFYDRSFAALDADGAALPRAIGVAWDEALLEAFDPLPTDRPLDAVVTPSVTYTRDARRSPER